ncbi:hypothetical protein CARUB_v10019610mg [Capsella rubella]|uniref:Uncharacterized protein n=1 Tax=Capsella rubella TaxID=81985 RepID=R0FTI3_9BRAS|nr:hypothetical protein CARUB_v10019610mg [Capsella rubella]
MNTFLIIINIEAIMYIRSRVIPVDDGFMVSMALCSVVYVPCCLINYLTWVFAITNVSLCDDAYIWGRIGHNMGFIIFLHLLYCISPYLALLAFLHFGLPCWLWYIADMIGPSLCEGIQALGVWWKFVNQPQRGGHVHSPVSKTN